jgi:hypothetical protein
MRSPLAALLLLASLPCAASAAPTAYFTWKLETLAGCYTAVSDQYAFDGTNVGVGVTGLTEPYVAYAFDIDLVAQDGGPLADAWRYDAAGCRTPANVSWKTHPSPGSPCGWLYAMDETPSPATSVTYDGTRVTFSFALAPSAPEEPVAANQALVAILSLLGGGECEGSADAVCFSLRSLRFQRPDGSWFEADRPVPVITLNAASFDGPAGCAAVPAHAATWGAMKVRYR